MLRPVRSRRFIGGGVLLAAALAMTATITRAPAAGVAADPFVAGQAGLASRPITGATSKLLADRAARAASALGLPPAARRSVSHVVDRFGGGEYDEVTEFDDRGRPTALQRFDSQGSIQAAVRFGWQGDGGSRLTGDAAVIGRARDLATAVGLRVEPAGQITRRSSQTGWRVFWARTVDGARVLGDGLRVQLWPDGSFHSLSVAEHALASQPSGPIDRTTALRIATAYLDRWFAGSEHGLISPTGAELVWTAPNDAFDNVFFQLLHEFCRHHVTVLLTLVFESINVRFASLNWSDGVME